MFSHTVQSAERLYKGSLYQLLQSFLYISGSQSEVQGPTGVLKGALHGKIMQIYFARNLTQIPKL